MNVNVRALNGKRFGVMLSAAVVASLLAAPLVAAAPKPKRNVRPGDLKSKISYKDSKAGSVKTSDLKGPHAKITADNDTHDFGVQWVGPRLNHTFRITNTGDATLKITRVKPSCGCTIAGNYPRTLEPGKTGEFPFAMNSTKLRGTFQKSITISSNDPLTPKLRLKLKGTVKRYVDVSPMSASFGRITDQEERTRELTITNNTDKPLVLTLNKPSTDYFTFEIVEKDPGKRYGLRVTAKPPFTTGPMRTILKIDTNIEKQKQIEIRANAVVPPRLEVQPTSVIVRSPRPGAAPPKSGISRVLRFTNYGKTEVRVLEATCDDPAITVNVRERLAGQAYTIEVKLPVGYTPPADGRTITLKTDDKEMPEITIPIRATLAPRRVKAPTKPAARPVEKLVGKKAPSFELVTLDGKPLNNKTIEGTVTVLNFFAPNCGFCKKQIPRLETVRKKYLKSNVRFVNVSQKMGRKEYTKDEVVDLVKKLGFRGELALNHDNSVGRKFQATGFPTMVVIDKKGRVAATHVGNISGLEATLATELDALLAGRPIPKDGAKLAAKKPVDTKKITAKKLPSKRVKAADLVGKPAPKFATKTIDGKELSNATLADAPATVLNFFAVNCGYCGKQIPRLEKVRKDFAGKGVRFVNVAETMRKEYDLAGIQDKMKKLGWGGELVRDSKNEIGPPFGATGYPTMIVLGKSGNVEAVNVGNVADLEVRVKAQLDALIAGTPIPTAYRKPPVRAKRKSPSDLVGRPAPKFETETVAGKTISNAEFSKFSATVLNFFAVNCGYCGKQIPRLETVRKEYESKGVRFINVAETMRKEYDLAGVQDKMKKLGWGGELARDPKNVIGPKFNATGYPTMVVIGKKGKIQAVNVGNVADLESRLKGQLDGLIAGRDLAKAKPAAPAKKRQRPAMAMVGKKVPTFALRTFGGTMINTSDSGTAPVTVLNFVAPNCGFCKRQVPNVEKVRAVYESKGVRFLNVAEKMGSKEYTKDQIAEIFAKAGSKLDLAKDVDNVVGKMFSVTSFPTMVVISKSGTIEHVNIGAKRDIENILKGQLDKLLKESN